MALARPRFLSAEEIAEALDSVAQSATVGVVRVRYKNGTPLRSAQQFLVGDLQAFIAQCMEDAHQPGGALELEIPAMGKKLVGHHDGVYWLENLPIGSSNQPRPEMTPEKSQLRIQETFQITGRGTVVVTGETTELPVGRALRATVTLPDGNQFTARAYKEWLLRRASSPVDEVEAYLLQDVEKDRVAAGSTIALEVI